MATALEDMATGPTQLSGENRVTEILAAVIITEVICTTFFLGRVISRVVILKKWGWDDSFASVAWLCSVAQAATMGIATKYGTGYHIQNVPTSLFLESLPVSSSTLITYQIFNLATKFSILAFYLSIFLTGRTRNLTWITIGVVATFGSVLLVGAVLQCSPITGRYTNDAEIACFDFLPLLVASTSLHTITDAWLIILVLPNIWKMTLPIRQKIALIILLSLGVIVIIAAIGRVTAITHLGVPGDVTWDALNIFMWSITETHAGLICASAPATKPLVRVIQSTVTSRLKKSAKSTVEDSWGSGDSEHNETKSEATTILV